MRFWGPKNFPPSYDYVKGINPISGRNRYIDRFKICSQIFLDQLTESGNYKYGSPDPDPPGWNALPDPEEIKEKKKPKIILSPVEEQLRLEKSLKYRELCRQRKQAAKERRMRENLENLHFAQRAAEREKEYKEAREKELRQIATQKRIRQRIWTERYPNFDNLQEWLKDWLIANDPLAEGNYNFM